MESSFFPQSCWLCAVQCQGGTVSCRHLHRPPSFLFLGSAIHRPLHSTCPWYAKMPPRYVFSSSSSAHSSFIIGFLFHWHLLLYYHPFIPSLSVPVGCSLQLMCVCVCTCVFLPPLPYLSPPLVQPRLIRGHCYGASNKSKWSCFPCYYLRHK